MPMALSMEEKRECILAGEKRLASGVAIDVIDKPLLVLWMILIPIFFVIYFFQLKRYKNGLNDFIGNFLITRERALDAVYESLVDKVDLDMDELVDVSDSPEQVREEYRHWVSALVEYYRGLLQATGDSFDELVRSAHNNKSSYLLHVNKLNHAERAYNKALLPYLPGDRETVSSVVAAMQKSTERIRREQAAETFS